jgi:hypothetical protein
MRIAVITCWAYRDAWKGFFALLDKFWPDHQTVYLLTDNYEPAECRWLPFYVRLISEPSQEDYSWGPRVANFCDRFPDEPILLLQEDFFLSSPLDLENVNAALRLIQSGAGCVRLYPVPGPDEDCIEPSFGIVRRGSLYRISSQAAIWNPAYLSKIARCYPHPGDFENMGTPLSCEFPEEVFSVKREARPWPIQYICAILRGRWDPNAKKLCESLNIEVDWSTREFAA